MTTSRIYKGPRGFYVPGKRYSLHVRQTLFGRIKVEFRQGYDEAIPGSELKYRNWRAFRLEWVNSVTKKGTTVNPADTAW